MKTLFDKDTWQEIFSSIGQNKVRTIITVIGVLWGIFLYIVLSGAAKGVDNGFERQFERISSNSLFIWGEVTSVPYDGFKTGRSINFKLSDVTTLKNRIPEIQHIAPRNSSGVFGGSKAQLVNGQKKGSYNIYGDFPILTTITTKNIFEGGRFINESDIQNKRKVCVIGERTLQELFEEGETPIGKFVRINGIYFKIIGVNKFVDGGGPGDDGDIFLPFTTYQRLYNTGGYVDFLLVAAYPEADIVKVETDIRAVLKELHHVSPKDKRALGGFNIGKMFKQITQFASGMTFLSMVIGLATIIGGIIGIGNILLISVKERTKEIGIRRAIGATPKEIRTQIMLESVFLTVIAGIIGIILGALVLSGINMATKNMTNLPFTNPTVPIPYILGALFLMVVLGTLIGLIPAHRAISIKPIDALREE
ncbi:MAG: FtsX-like permease family protein [Flavobacteriales bacterium]|jgi:putative ABC transport system permease protein|nr:FtsX-like permease family protein [Flavobacteriales bacterium]MBT5750818.1 FtsX-like permease family protein [Flavobacteriales bacterium]